MPFDEAQARQFDEAAEKALAELHERFESWSARWYLKAGHKRLGRILVAQSKHRD
jgi:hypothetical protein